jgi:pimeloyl-ACP methyl ester carboxylesterase
VIPGLQHRRLVSYDGTELAYQVRGHGPAVVLVNGLGGIPDAFRHVYSFLGEEYKILTWDYRGLHGSKRPRDLETLTVPAQCRDLEMLLAAERMERAVFIGWSMGVQLIFEYYRARRRQMEGIVALNGTAGLPLRSAVASRRLGALAPALLRAARLQSGLVGRATRAWIDWRGAVPAMQRIGMLSRDADVDNFLEVARGFASMDWKLYLHSLARLGDHDACDVLPEVSIPTLIIAGDRDLLTPPHTAEAIHRAVRGSRLVVIPGGTHYTPVEYPRIIQDELAGFLAGLPLHAAPLVRGARASAAGGAAE